MVSGLFRSAYDCKWELTAQIRGKTYRDDLCAEIPKLLCGIFGGITSDGLDVVFGSSFGVGEDSLDNGTALLASGTEDDNGLLSHGSGRFY